MLAGVISIKEVRDMESTVLYHVYQAAQLNHESMKDFIRYLKSVSYASEYTLQPFVLAVLMSVSSIYEDQVAAVSISVKVSFLFYSANQRCVFNRSLRY